MTTLYPPSVRKQTPHRIELSSGVALELRMPAVTLVASVILAACGGRDGGDIAPPAAPPAASAETLCNAFAGRTIEGAVVTKATFVPTAGDLREHCVVRGEMPQDLDFEVRLPTDWNKRTVFIGGGGFDGVVMSPVGNVLISPDLAQRGYATIATNHGHDASVTPDATFALDPQMLAEYGYLSVPSVLPSAKAILRERYGSEFAGTKMIYEGCSGGGRQALIQAQRYPDLFDGIIARAPANEFVGQFLWYQKVERQLAQPGAALSSGKMKAISDAVLAKCDALDGLADKIIGRPESCSFDPLELACAGAETDSCLTPAQVQSARTFYAPTDVADGRYTWPGFPVGGELTLQGPAVTRGWGTTRRGELGAGFMKYMVTQNASVDWLQVDPTQYTSRLDQLAAITNAVDPDLTRFKARGGKLILWTGMTDWLITANNATGYYQKVVQKTGSQAAADEFTEYYRTPGVQHCTGGTGTDKLDLAGPMFDWLEKGVKPSSTRLIASQQSGTVPPGSTALSRPVCRYPEYPKYIGGDPNAAASFTCTTP